MNLNFAGKRVLVTGGSKGIGFACASAFIAEGAKVAICSRGQENIDRALQSLHGAVGFAADCSDADSAAQMVARVEAEFGPVDILVNSAGAAKRTLAPDLTPAHWRAAMDAKYFSTINVVDPLIKRMAARKSGVVVNVIGTGGKVASSVHLPGGAANAALMLATAGLGTAYAPSGVRVVGVSPSFTETGRVTAALKVDAAASGLTMEAARTAMVAKVPLGRLATPEEVADVVLFLASDRAGFVTGTTVSVDGGTTGVVL